MTTSRCRPSDANLLDANLLDANLLDANLLDANLLDDAPAMLTFTC